MRILLQALLFVPALAAQTTVALVATTDISVLTNDAGANATFDTVPANTAIGAWPNNVALSTSQSPTGKFLSASTSIYPGIPNSGGIAFNFFEHASCRGVAGDYSGSSASATAPGTLGAHSVLATFGAPPGTAGNIRISLLANSGNNGTAFASVDVNDDNTVEFAQGTSGLLLIPYTFGASGQVVIRVTNETSVPGVGLTTFNRSYSEIQVGFWPDLTATCQISTYGQGCGAVQAAGSEQVNGSTRTISLQATGCFPNDPVIVALGSQQIALPLLAGCSLLCNAEGVALAGADAAGIATSSFSIPSTVIGTTYAQMLPITLVNGALVLTASNGVRIYCF